MPEERISRTAVSQRITMTQASTAIAPYAVVSIPSPLLTIDADPFQVLPGDVITYSVAITNVADVPLTSVVLSDTLPAGVVYVAQSAVGFSYSLRDNRLTWALGALAPGQAARGRFQLRATVLGIGTLITNTVSAASANAPAVTASAVVEVAPPRQNRVWATPGEGGWLRSEDRRVELRAPAGAVAQRTELRYAAESALPLPEHLLYAFRLEASDEAGQPVTQFGRPVTLSAFFDPRDLPPGALDRLALFHLNEDSGEWELVPSQIDLRWRRVVGRIEHFSLYGLGIDGVETPPSFSVDRMTRVRGAQASLYNGSITTSYGFDLPPGRGGLTPALGLNYNSANHSQQQGHYSYVGHGWGMPGADYVQRDPASGKTTLLLGGQAYTLECYSNCSVWFVKENPLVKVAYQQSGLPFYGGSVVALWTITTPDGLVYEYRGQINLVGSTLQYPYPMTFYWSSYTNGSGGEWRDPIWERIPLTQVRDRHGNQMSYAWGYELNQGGNTMPYWPSTSIISTPQHIRAVLLTGISYNSGRNQVALGYGSRLDRPEGYDQGNTWRFYTEQRVTSVAVQAVWSGQSSPTTLRTYVLNHRDQGDPNASRSTKLLSLMYVEEQAGNRPVRTSFDYSGHDGAWPCTYRYLTKVQNAFGGVVEFTAIGGESANNPWDCPSGNPLYWRPPTVTARTERDTITGSLATWTYGTAQWNDDAHGFARVWVTAPDQFSCEVHEFKQMTEITANNWRDHLTGREWQTTLCSACTTDGQCVANGELSRRQTDWNHSSADLPLADYSALPEQDRPRFVWAAEERSYESRFNNDGTLAAAGTPIKRTAYEYQPARQFGNQGGARQFGNLTSVKEYWGTFSGFEATPLRSRVMQYRPNESTWVIGKPAINQLFGGNEATLIAETRLYYDDNSSHTAAPSNGLLTKQETMSVLNGAYQSNPASKARRFKYYANGNLEWQRDEFDRLTTFFYDAWYQAHLVCQVNPLGHQAKTTYYGVPGDGTCNTSNGSTASVFNRFGLAERQWDANNALTEYRYDDLGWMTAMAVAPDVIGAPTVSHEFRSLGSIAVNQPFWLHQQQRDTSGGDNTLHTWTYYDGFGRVLQTKAEADTSGGSDRHVETSFDYTWRDAVRRQGVPRFVNGSVAVAGASAPAYSPPNPPDWTAADQYETVYTYDRLGRLSAKTLPNGAQIRRYYNVIPDAQNRSHTGVAVIDEANRQTIQQTDPFGRLVVAKQYTNSYASGPNWTDAAYAQVRYDYNVADQLVTAAGVDPDAGGTMPRPTTQITYDGFGQKVSMADPDMGAWSYGYDSAGNLTRQTDARNQRTCFYYDTLNRLKGKTYSTGTAVCPADPGSYTVSYSYDAGTNGKGRRTGMADPSGSTAWEYDVRGRMTKETKIISGAGGGTFVTQWTAYDSMDRVRTMVYPDGESVTFSYTSQGPIKKVEGTSTYVGETLYSALGQVSDRYLGSTAGLIRQKSTYTQAENFRLTALQSGVASAYSNLQNLSYSYDAVGNVKSIVDVVNSNQRQCYNYDALHRLTRGFTTDSATCAAPNLAIGSGPFDETTTYQDALGGRGGNLTSKSGVGNYTYGVAQAADCPEGALVKANAVVAAGSNYLFYCYDQNGNLRRRKAGTSATTYSYDAENRLVTVSGAAAATFVYDGDDNRVKATFGSTTTVYVGNTYERDNGTTVRKYYYAGSVRVAMRSGGQTYYLLGDHLGGTNVTANGTDGGFLGRVLYKPWGETRFTTGTTPTTWRFTGQREDATIGLYYFNARYLDPQLGRFISPDTIVPEPGDPQALNRYSYVTNRPTIAIDPTGHDLMIVGGYGGDLDIEIWQEWIMEYKGWSLDKWNEFFGVWSNANDFGARNAALRAEGIGIFSWGGTSSASALTAAKSATTRSMVDELAQQMAGMKDVTLLGWSKGGNLVLQYLWAQEQGRLTDAVIPVRAVLLAPGTHPLGVVRFGASWVRNEVPGGWPSTINICSYGDVACPLTIRNATSNINPPEEEGHGPFRQYAAEVINSLNVEGHHQAREALEVTPNSN